MWNVLTGATECSIVWHVAMGALSSVVKLADGRFVFAFEDDTLCVWSVTTSACERVLRGHTDCVCCVCALSGSRVVSASHDESLRVWNVDTGACERGRVASASAGDETVRIWRL